MKNDLKSNYTVKNFMVNELGLKGSELAIYAFIYSFSYDGINSYYGTREYMAKTLGVCGKTVERALKSLTKKELIIRKNRTGYFRGNVYCVNLDKVPASVSENVDNSVQKVGIEVRWNGNSEAVEVSSKRTDCTFKTDDLACKYNNNITINTSSSSSINNASPQLMKLFEDEAGEKPVKYATAHFGRNKLVVLSFEQYLRLTELINEDMVADYIARLDLFKMENDRSKHPHSDYRQIAKWIDEDYSV